MKNVVQLFNLFNHLLRDIGFSDAQAQIKMLSANKALFTALIRPHNGYGRTTTEFYRRVLFQHC
jgi:hypothetical protein